MTEDTKYVSVTQLARRYGVDRSTVWRWVSKKDSTFPQPVRFSDQCTRWKLDEIEQYDAEREQSAA